MQPHDMQIMPKFVDAHHVKCFKVSTQVKAWKSLLVWLCTHNKTYDKDPKREGWRKECSTFFFEVFEHFFTLPLQVVNQSFNKLFKFKSQEAIEKKNILNKIEKYDYVSECQSCLKGNCLSPSACHNPFSLSTSLAAICRHATPHLAPRLSWESCLGSCWL